MFVSLNYLYASPLVSRPAQDSKVYIQKFLHFVMAAKESNNWVIATLDKIAAFTDSQYRIFLYLLFSGFLGLNETLLYRVYWCSLRLNDYNYTFVYFKGVTYLWCSHACWYGPAIPAAICRLDNISAYPFPLLQILNGPLCLNSCFLKGNTRSNVSTVWRGKLCLVKSGRFNMHYELLNSPIVGYIHN